jgi:hypothetical protein
MKKFIITSFLLSLLVVFTSCLGDGSSTEEDTTFGVVVRKGSRLLILDSKGYYTSSPELLTTLNEGDCIHYRRFINFDVQESNEYYSVSVVDYYKVPYADFRNNVDTDNIIENEFTISQINPITLLDDKLFFSTVHPKVASDQKNNFHIECTETPETIDGKRVYNLYVRVVKRVAGEKTETPTALLNVADISRLIQTEKNAGNKVLNIKFNYISELKEDATVATWSSETLYDRISIPE